MTVTTGVASALVFQGNLEQDDVEHLIGSIINRTADEYRLSIDDVTVTYDMQQCQTSIGWSSVLYYDLLVRFPMKTAGNELPS